MNRDFAEMLAALSAAGAAETILYCAQHPVREVFVGAARRGAPRT